MMAKTRAGLFIVFWLLFLSGTFAPPPVDYVPVAAISADTGYQSYINVSSALMVAIAIDYGVLALVALRKRRAVAANH
jgi:hypothetical protein